MPAATKYDEELGFWDNYLGIETEEGARAHYKRIMLGIARETSDDFLAGKIVADFGCGPAGSLCWATKARLKIGIDVLADRYSRFNIRSHDVVYVTSTEQRIPLPSNYVDIMFTMNAMDHVNNFGAICGEIVRVLAPGGIFCGSFNLGEEPTFSEPQTLTEDKIKQNLLRYLTIESYYTGPRGPIGNVYEHMLNGSGAAGNDYLWVKARKPSH